MVILSNKDAHEIAQILADYSLDIGTKTLQIKDVQARRVYNMQLCKVLDTILIMTKKLYTPRKRKAKKTKDK